MCSNRIDVQLRAFTDAEAEAEGEVEVEVELEGAPLAATSSGYMLPAAAAAAGAQRGGGGGVLSSPNRALEPLLESEYEMQSECGTGGDSASASAASSKRVSRASADLSPERLAHQRLELEDEFGRLLDWLDECESLLEFVSQSIDESAEPISTEGLTDAHVEVDGSGPSASSCPSPLSSTFPAPGALAVASDSTVSNASASNTSASPSAVPPTESNSSSSSNKKKLDIDQQISLVKVSVVL